jgi:hypothetical protein
VLHVRPLCARAEQCAGLFISRRVDQSFRRRHVMLVLAAKDIKVPREEKPRDYITDTPPEGEVGYTVPDSAYYLRRVAEGDLVEIGPAMPDGDVVEGKPAKARKGA